MARKPRQSGALFYEDESGKRQDRELHEEIMRGADEAAATAVGIEQARRIGLTEEEIQILFGDQRR